MRRSLSGRRCEKLVKRGIIDDKSAPSGSKPSTAPAKCTAPREYPEAPVVGVGAAIVKNAQVLLVRRANAPVEGDGAFLVAVWSSVRRWLRQLHAKCMRNVLKCLAV